MNAETIKQRLNGTSSAERVVYVDEIGSTNDAAKALAAAEAPSGTVVIAERQTAGRGRLGRTFASPSGCGLYLSYLLRPTLRGDDLRTLTPRAAVCVRTAIEETCGVAPQIKWVNDLLLGGKKICGILTELTFSGPEPDAAVIGIGINCNTPPEVFPPDLRPIAGSILEATGVSVDRERLAAALIRTLAEIETCDWLPAYRAACVTLGRPVLIPGEPPRRALAQQIGPLGELCVRYEDGRTEKIAAGEVSVRSVL